MRFAVLVLSLCLSSLSGCGQSARDKAIHATYDTTNAARAGFVAFDLSYEKSLVSEHAGDPVAQRAAVEEWKRKRALVVEVFGDTYRALATAAILSDDQSLSGLVKAGAVLSDELKSIGVKP